MAYQKQTYVDYPDTSTPITAERLNHSETGIYEAHQGLQYMSEKVQDLEEKATHPKLFSGLVSWNATMKFFELEISDLTADDIGIGDIFIGKITADTTIAKNVIGASNYLQIRVNLNVINALIINLPKKDMIFKKNDYIRLELIKENDNYAFVMLNESIAQTSQLESLIPLGLAVENGHLTFNI